MLRVVYGNFSVFEAKKELFVHKYKSALRPYHPLSIRSTDSKRFLIENIPINKSRLLANRSFPRSGLHTVHLRSFVTPKTGKFSTRSCCTFRTFPQPSSCREETNNGR